LTIICNDVNAADYYVTLYGADFSSFTYTVVGNCNFQARWFINIRGTDNIDISGDSFPGVPGGVVYNVIGCDRVVTVHDTALAGALLAPCSTLDQPSGVILGKVVAGDIVSSLQINRENTCPDDIEVQVPVVVASIQGNELAQFSTNFLVNGDNVDGKTVESYRGDNTYDFDGKVNWTPGRVLYVTANTRSGRAPSPTESGASVVAFSVALIAILALFF